ncbi:MAG: BTAD domain-containing putative transcriptional regulator [Pseudonocardia sp.]
MRVRDLGALAIAVGAEERLVAGIRATAMLALLTINVNRRVPVDALIDAAWGPRATPGAASALESHIGRLRQLLEPGRRKGQRSTVLVNDAGGYRLIAATPGVDSLLFAELAGQVRGLLLTGDAATALARADEALALWRGRPYGALGDQDWARPAVARLDELHGQVRERRIEALLATGELDHALSDLEILVAQMPFRESMRALQMLALYRSGRGEQALHTYQETRRALVDDVGTEPGKELQELHRRILNNDPELAGGPDGAGVARRGGPRDVVEVHLPSSTRPMIGRDDDRRRIGALVAEHRLVTVVGAAGCGKTRVAVEVARECAASFPDGVWFVDLTAVSDPDLVVEVVVSTIAFSGSATATPLADLGNYLRTRRMLLVLDNCEHVLGAVARIAVAALGDVPDGSLSGSILATSREPVGVAGETIWTLEPLGLPAAGTEPFPQAAPAVELFLRRVRAAVPTLQVDEHVVARAVEICVALDGLPLPIELAAARARSFTLDDIATQVSIDPGRLRRIGRGPADHRATVRSAIEWSHRMLTPPEQVAHRRIAVLSGPFTTSMAAAVVGAVADGDVDDLLAQLVHRSMLTSEGARRPGGPTVFRQLATVRAHAQHALADAGEASEVTDRRDAWVASLLAGRPRLGRATEATWYHVLDDGYATVRAALARHLLDEPSAVGGRLAHRLQFYWYYRARLVEGTRWLRLARDVIGNGEPADAMLAGMALASALLVQGRVEQARPHVDDALERLPQVDPLRLVEIGEGLVGLGAAAWQPGAADLVVTVHRQLARVAERVGDVDLGVLADAVGCIGSVAAGRPDEAVAEAQLVYDRAVAVGNIMAGWISAGPPMIVALLAGRPDDGIPWLHRLMQGHVRFGTGGGGLFIENRANFAAMAGEHRQAVQLYAAARAETRRAAMLWPRRELTLQLLDRTRGTLGRGEFEQAWQEGERLSLADIAGLARD